MFQERKKLIWGAILAVLVIAGGIFYSQQPRYSMSAKELVAEYNRSVKDASGKYDGKVIRVSGRVVQKGQFRDTGDPFVCLYLHNNYEAFLAGFDMSQKNGFNSIKEGDFIVIQGKVQGLVEQDKAPVFTVQMYNSKLVD